MKKAVIWDVTLCGSCKNRRFGGTYHFHHQGDKIRSVLQLLVAANVVPRSPILVTLMMEAIRPSEKLVLTRATWRNIPEDGIQLEGKAITHSNLVNISLNLKKNIKYK
jgi:hypothetical protein